MYRQFNDNPVSRRAIDCTVRAISNALGESWDRTYVGLCVLGYELGDMPDSNYVWGTYLARRGYVGEIVQDAFKRGYTVRDFCRDHPCGTFLLAPRGHVLTVRDGDWYDSWDSGDEIPLICWRKDD